MVACRRRVCRRLDRSRRGIGFIQLRALAESRRRSEAADIITGSLQQQCYVPSSKGFTER